MPHKFPDTIRNMPNFKEMRAYGRKLDVMKTKEKIKLFNEIKVFV